MRFSLNSKYNLKVFSSVISVLIAVLLTVATLFPALFNAKAEGTNPSATGEKIYVDFTEYNQVKYVNNQTKDPNTGISFKVDKTNGTISLKNNKIGQGIPYSSFLLDPTGTLNNTHLKDNTNYRLKIRYKFNEISFPEGAAANRLGFYMGFKGKINEYPESDKGIDGMWTKDGYYGNSTKKDGIGIYSVDTADGNGNIWESASTDGDGWITAYFDFITAENISDKNIYVGFTTGRWGIFGLPSIDYSIDYIEITENGPVENICVDFSKYNLKSGVNAASGFSLNNEQLNFKSDKAKSGIENSTFLLSPVGTSGNARLKPGVSYRLEMRYRFDRLDFSDTSTPLGVYIGFKNTLSEFVSATSSELAGIYSKSGRDTVGKGITSLATADGGNALWKVSAIDKDGWITGYFTFTTPAGINSKDIYMGFTYNSAGIAGTPGINYTIDYIDISASGSEADDLENSVINDETYPANMRENANSYSGIASSNEFYTGSSSFRYNAAEAGKAHIMLHDTNKQPFKVSPLNQYMVSFWYKQKTAASATAINILTADESDVNKAAFICGTVDIPAGNSNEWTKAVVSFTAFSHRKSGAVGDTFYLTFESADAEIFIDDIEVLTKSAIVFDTRGGNSMAPLKGKIGTVASLPEPIYNGHSFSGWYYDPELKQPATDVKFPADKTEITLYAAWDVFAPSLIMDFENAPYDDWSGANFFDKKTLSIENGVGVNNSKAVKYAYTTDIGRYNMNERGFELYKGSDTFKVENGKTYMLTFSYKLESCDASAVKVTPFTCQAHNSWGMYQKYSSSAFTIPKKDVGAGWKQGMLMFTADIKSSGKSVFLHIMPSSDLNATVYFDDIKLYAYKDGQTLITYHIDENTVEYTAPFIGDEILLPTPVKEGYRFLGWYEDEKYTTKVETDKYKVEGPKTFYAKWKATSFSTVIDFENYPEGWLKEPASGTNLRFGPNCEISKTASVSGTSSFRYTDSLKKDGAYSKVQLYHNGTELTVEDNQSYLISFMYRVDSISLTTALKVTTASKDNFWSNRSDCGTYTFKSTDVGKGWQRASIIVTTKLAKSNANALFLGISCGKGSVDMYIDDVEVTMLEEGQSAVILECNNGTNPITVIGNIGDRIIFPDTIIRRGYTLGAWYTDAKFTNRFKGQYFEPSVLNLYAKWNMNDEIQISFEDEYLDKSTTKNTLDSAKRSSDQASDGSYSLHFANSENSRIQANAICTIDNVPVTLDNNQKYVMTYDYYVVKSRDTATKSSARLPAIAAKSAMKDNLWLSGNVYTDNVTMYADLKNTWCSGAITFTTDFKNPDANVLFIRATNSSYCDFYIDNIKLIKIDNSKEVVLLDTHGTYRAEAYVTAQKGQAVKLPTNITRAGHTFVGWSPDANYKKRLDNPYTVTKEGRVYAILAKNNFYESFETFETYYEKGSYKYLDMDYELYNSSKSNNSRANVRTGNWSLHHIGADFHSTNVQVLKRSDMAIERLVPECVYNVSMWVKMDSSKHTDGAIKLGSCSAALFPWAIDGKYYNIYKISDLADGEWHKVSFNFMATSNYLSLQIPGNCSVFVDDVAITLIKGGTLDNCDKSLDVKEYVGKRDGAAAENNETIKKKIVDESLTGKKGDTGNAVDKVIEQVKEHATVIIPITVAVVLAAVIVSVVCVRAKAKKKGAK